MWVVLADRPIIATIKKENTIKWYGRCISEIAVTIYHYQRFCEIMSAPMLGKSAVSTEPFDLFLISGLISETAALSPVCGSHSGLKV